MDLLVLDGWRSGLNKVALTRILCSRANISLAAAKHHVDELLAGHTVTLPLADTVTAEAIAREVSTVGAVAHVAEGSAHQR